ncbi:hypothetical protein [Aurantiacibacter aquimixticola]|uniref:hypothetical protein n=1 Tax=Aurantiacibacter aquimixticola TaxID=1958945 RepID=UPI00105880BF|nr:hypothetical protein [Aurantiacibacter aquimixticola]
MNRKIGLLFTAAACGLLVTSCGDDETPDPEPTESPTPTPTPPTAGDEFDLDSDFAATSGNANYIYAYFTADGDMDAVFSSAARVNGGASISYTAATQAVSFTFPDLGDAVTFDQDDVVNFVTMPEAEATYSRDDEGLELFVPFSEVMRVLYTRSNQAFTRDEVDGTLQSNRVSLFFRPVTTDADIDTTLSFTGDVDVRGGDPGETASDAISSNETTVTITPGATDTISGTIVIFDDTSGTATEAARCDLDTTVAADGTFAGTCDDTDNDLNWQYAGSLAGDEREEIFIIFGATADNDPDDTSDDDDDRRYVGSFIGD